MVHELVSSKMTGGGVGGLTGGVGGTPGAGAEVCVVGACETFVSFCGGAVAVFRPRFLSRSRSSCPRRTASARLLRASVAAGSVGGDTRSVGRALSDIEEFSGR